MTLGSSSELSSWPTWDHDDKQAAHLHSFCTHTITLFFTFSVCVPSHCSHVWLFATLWTEAHWAPLSMKFSRQEYWSGLPCPPPGHLPDPGIEPKSVTLPALAGQLFTMSATWEASCLISGNCFWLLSLRCNGKITTSGNPSHWKVTRIPTGAEVRFAVNYLIIYFSNL